LADHVSLPRYDDLLSPTIAVLAELGGSGSNDEIDDALASKINATQAQLDVTYASSGAPVLVDRMAWARSHLKIAGFLDNPTRGVWILTEAGRSAASKTNDELKQIAKAVYKASVAARKAAQIAVEGPSGQETTDDDANNWSKQLLERVLAVEPAMFERLCQRLLRASGFTRVEVSGKTGDGGIDGAGVLRMNLISFQVLFQCKRWKGSVGSEVVRNFRGAMQGRADKGLIVTTGTFTSDARREATRDGAPAIDLIDGEALCLLLKDLRLGVRVEQRTVEDVSIDERFFASI
jgi:restriction system protein